MCTLVAEHSQVADNFGDLQAAGPSRGTVGDWTVGEWPTSGQWPRAGIPWSMSGDSAAAAVAAAAAAAVEAATAAVGVDTVRG